MPAVADPPRDDKGKFVSPNPEKAADKPAEKPPEKPTEEGLATITSFAEGALGIKPETETPEEKAAKEKVEADKAAADKKKVAPAKPAPAKPAPKPAAAPAPLTADQIAEAAARGVASAIKPKVEDENKPEPKDDDLPEENKEELQIIEKMEQMNPERCKGFAERYKNNTRKLIEYSRQWEKDHPGEEFDYEAPEHEEFFQKNGLVEFWNKRDYDKALAKIVSDESVSAQSKALDARIAELDRRQRLREAEPEIAASQHEAMTTFATTIAEAVPGIIGEDGKINNDKVNELREEYPRAFGALTAVSFEAGVLYRAWNQLQPWIEKEPVRMINGKPNPMHDEWSAQQALGQFAAEKERALMAGPADDQRDGEGRSFLPAAKYWQLPEADRGSHWTFSFNDLLALRAASLAKVARQNIAFEDQQFAARAKKRGITLPEPLPAGNKATNGNGEHQADDTSEKPDSPSLSSGSKGAAKRAPATPVEENPLSSFAEKAIG